MTDEKREQSESELDEDLTIDEESADSVTGGVRADLRFRENLNRKA